MFRFLRLITHPEDRESGKTNAPPKSVTREARKMRQNMPEKRIDKTIENSFPASDPPGWY